MKLDKEHELSKEELEQVSGGCDYEISDDSKFLNVLLRGTDYHRCDRYGKFKIFGGAANVMVHVKISRILGGCLALRWSLTPVIIMNTG